MNSDGFEEVEEGVGCVSGSATHVDVSHQSTAK
jgi:hypothetical protein